MRPPVVLPEPGLHELATGCAGTLLPMPLPGLRAASPTPPPPPRPPLPAASQAGLKGTASATSGRRHSGQQVSMRLLPAFASQQSPFELIADR